MGMWKGDRDNTEEVKRVVLNVCCVLDCLRYHQATGQYLMFPGFES